MRKATVIVLSLFILAMSCSVSMANGIWDREGRWRACVEKMAVGTCAYEVSLEWLGLTPFIIGTDSAEWSPVDGGTPQKIRITNFQNIIECGLLDFAVTPTKSKRTNIPLVAIEDDRPCGIGGYIQTIGKDIPFSIIWDENCRTKLFFGSDILDERY